MGLPKFKRRRKQVCGRYKCRRCEVWKIPAEFRRKGSYINGDPRWHNVCWSCERKSNLNRYKTRYKGAPHQKAGYRYTLKTCYGLTEEDFNKMYLEQEGKCYLCGQELGNTFLEINGQRPSVDHCHDTGKVRKILCSLCNTALGKFKDDAELLKKAIDYLYEHRN